MIYGSSRLGTWKSGLDLLAYIPAEPEILVTDRGSKQYEMNDHLGNVHAVVSDRKKRICDEGEFAYYEADIRSTYDYYAFGMMMPGRDYKPELPCTEVTDTIHLEDFVEYANDFNGNETGEIYLESTVLTSSWIQTGGKLKISANSGTQNYGYGFLLPSRKGEYEVKFNIATPFPGTIYRFFGAAVYDLDSLGNPINAVWLDLNYGISQGYQTYIINNDSTRQFIEFQFYNWNHNVTETNRYFTLDSLEVLFTGDTLYTHCEVDSELANKNGYRFGFNGKEKVDEVYGDANAYDFGARLYDPRLGRFLSVDPKEKMYSFMAPYCYASNDPIRCLDIAGEGPGKPIDGQYNGTGNVIIILVDNDEIENWNSALAKASMGEKWDYIVVTDLEAAKTALDRTYGMDNIKINNMVIRSHSTTLVDNSNGTTTFTGALFVPTSDVDVAKSQIYDSNGNPKVNSNGKPKTENSETSLRTPISADDIKNYHPLNSSETNKEVGALIGILSYLNTEANLVFTACSQGNSDYLWNAVGNLTTGNVTVYANKSLTGTITSAQGTYGSFLRMETPLSIGEKRGWKKYTYSDGESTGSEDINSDMKISRDGTVQTTSFK